MKIAECNFTKENIVVGVFGDNDIILGNKHTKQLYRVVKVEPFEPKIPDYLKKAKTTMVVEE